MRWEEAAGRSGADRCSAGSGPAPAARTAPSASPRLPKCKSLLCLGLGPGAVYVFQAFFCYKSPHNVYIEPQFNR